jgi:hypothetical protein
VSLAALELHDAGLLVVGQSALDSPLAPPSPGYVLLDGDKLLTGAAAAGRERLRPRHVRNRFWSEPDGPPPGRPFPDRMTRGDLAHAQLSDLWKGVGGGIDELLLVLTGAYSGPQLGLILGIARAADLPVSGLVDAATAAAVHPWPGERLLHLDLHLHRAIVTELLRTGDVVRRRVEVAEGDGLVTIRGALARRVAELFLRETRFDPLHAAETEQRLYDGLPYWLNRLRSEDGFDLRFDTGGSEHKIELTRERLAAAVDTEYERIARLVSAVKPAGEPTTLLLAHAACAFPGIESRLSKIANLRIVALPRSAAAAGALLAHESISAKAEALPFVTRLPLCQGYAPALRPPAEQPDAVPEADVHPGLPTHLLLEEVAHVVTGVPFVLGTAIPEAARGVNLDLGTQGISRVHCSVYRRETEVWVEDHSTHGSFLNGERVEGKSPLAVGDRLRLGSPGVEILMIRVAYDDGPSQS